MQGQETGIHAKFSLSLSLFLCFANGKRGSRCLIVMMISAPVSISP